MTKKVNNKREDKKKKKVKKKSKVLGKILLLLIILLIILVGVIIYKTKQNGGGMQGLLQVLVGHDDETVKNLEPIQVLLMGMSSDNGLKLTDTIIIGSYDPKTQKASLLSIPRDTFVGKNAQTGTGSDKINALYQKSPEKTLAKVNELTGLNIEYYMVIDNQALIELVDVIGGVEFYVPMNMKYTDKSQNLYINLKEGLQLIDGNKAEQLLRFRKGNNGETYPEEYGGNDYGRMRTQREFIIETAKQTLKAKNILKVKDIIDLAYEYIDTNLSIATIKDYVPYALNVDISTVESAVLPGGSYGPPKYPLWFFIHDKEETAALVEQLYGSGEETTDDGTTEVDNSDDKDDVSNNNTETDDKTNTTTSEITKKEAGQIKIELLNGTDSYSTLTEVRKALVAQGYKVTRMTTTTSTLKTTIINKSDVDDKFTGNIKEILGGVGNISSSSVSSSNVDITIIIGKDYK